MQGVVPHVTEIEADAMPPGSPQRRCIATGEHHDRARLLRFVVGPDDMIVPDVEARLPGRGLWLMPRRDIVERALAKRIFARAARRQVRVPPDLSARVEGLLARRCSEDLGLARRAGLAVAGFDRVGEAIRAGRAALLLAALDGAASGRDKLAGQGRRLATASVLTAAELAAAFGRERIVHVAVAGGPLCRRLTFDLMRLAGMRPEAAVDCDWCFAPAEAARKDGGIEAHD
jgi:hypothetical protein